MSIFEKLEQAAKELHDTGFGSEISTALKVIVDVLVGEIQVLRRELINAGVQIAPHSAPIAPEPQEPANQPTEAAPIAPVTAEPVVAEQPIQPAPADAELQPAAAEPAAPEASAPQAEPAPVAPVAIDPAAQPA